MRLKMIEKNNISPQGEKTQTAPGNSIVAERPQHNQESWKPIVFVKDSFLTNLHITFEVREFSDLDDISQDRDCYIIKDCDTSETTVRKLAYKLNRECSVHCTRQSVESLSSSNRAAQEFTIRIIEFAQSYEDWAKRCDEEQITIGEAYEIAEEIYRNEYFTATERQAEIAKLSGRIESKASYQWGKLMRSLEVEFQRELIARGIVSDADLRKELTVLTEENNLLTRRIKVSELAKIYKYSTKEIAEMLAELEQQLQLVEDADDNRNEINHLLDLNNQGLDLNDFLPAKLARPLKQYCQWLSIKEEVILLPLLTATSSLHKARTKITLQRNINFCVPPTIFGGVVAESGQKKSPITRQIITSPLGRLDSEVQAKYLEEKEQYEEELREWESAKASAKQSKQPFDEPKPEEPKPPTSFWFTNATSEGIKKEAQNYPEKILFGFIDELAGLFNSQNAYRGGKGSDRQEMLSFYDGYSFNDLRSGQSRKGKGYLSIFGTIQPDVLKNIMRDCSDPDGQWSRFLFVQQPLLPSKLPDEEDGGIDITDLLAGIYRKLTLVPVTEYRLTRKAFKLYQPWYDELEQKRANEPQPGLRAAYSKAEGCTGKLALNLHVLHELSSGVTPSPEVPVERMREAIELMKFFLGQTKKFYSQFDDGITPHLTKLIELSNRKGWLKARDVSQSYSKKERPNADVVRQWFIQAEELGFGKTRGTGKKLEFISSSQNVGFVDNCRSIVDNQSTVESTDITTFEQTVGFVGQKVDALSTSETPSLDNQLLVENENPINQEADIIPPTKPTESTKPSNADIEGNTAVDNLPTNDLQLPTKSPELPITEIESSVKIREGSTVYPTTGKFQGKECRVSGTRGEEIWVYPVTNQKGVAAKPYAISELSFEAPKPAPTNEDGKSKYEQANLFGFGDCDSYKLTEDDYLQSADD